MAPSRKSKSVNKKFSYVNEVASSKDGDTSSKRSGKRKRNLSDMLGPQWTKEELERFYEAYRKYGKDWKKVATMIHNRSMEMVEALYTMNRAYLSLPEGTASVVGLIAMMTDHYSVMGGSDSEQESNEGMGVSLKPQKRSRGKLRDQPSKSLEKPLLDLLKFHSSASSCMSLLKRRSESRPRAVGKRTPRVPISFSHDKSKGERYFSPIRQGMKLKADSVDDDVAHEVALALTEASQRGGSPQVSRTPNRKAETPSPAINSDRMNADSETTSAKIHGSEVDEDACELSLGSTEADNADYAREKNYSRNRRHRYYTKEACSGTEEGHQLCEFKGKFNAEVADAKTSRTLIKGSRKRSKKVLFEGMIVFAFEDTSFDALQTLADLSLMMPETAPDTKSSVQFKEDKNEVEKTKLKGNHPVPGAKGNASKTSRHGKKFGHDVHAIPEAKEETHLVADSKYENDDDSQLGESPNIEISNEAKNLLSKGKRSNNIGHPKQGKPLRPPEHASSSSDKGRDLNNSAPSTIQVSSVNQVNLPTKVRSKRKMDAQKPAIRKDIQSSDNIVKGKTSVPVTLFHDRALNLKEKLCNFLNSYLARRWCIFEWFYSTIDYPWFAKQEFVEYLDHVGLGHIPRLTRVEWGVIRSSLGKPRRFSEQFLKEREKLNQYRESVRRHYAELCAGTGEGLPTDLARPLSVGQRVIAIHPKTWEIHDGSVLTVDYGRYRIQFDNPELGGNLSCRWINDRLRLWEDIDFKKKMEEIKFAQCDNLENANSPSRTSPSTFGVGNLSQPVKVDHQVLIWNLKLGLLKLFYSQQAMNSQPSALSLAQAREADVEALSQLTRALDKKVPISCFKSRSRSCFRLFGFTVIAAIADAIAAVAVTRMAAKPLYCGRNRGRGLRLWCLNCDVNGEVLENQKGGDNYLKDSDSFKKQYAAVLLQLNEVNEQA
ncbi:Always early, putative isoform 2 [Hibiscus syriacus]|uniref:Always early, putative isoform 2 n=1 Tax=Hibiscus syriacus TaxID=106335 RepID=A0A6A3C3N1_HIBSY|nr:Always early, putative isoform 2 [Hibiscus syriacus]